MTSERTPGPHFSLIDHPRYSYQLDYAYNHHVHYGDRLGRSVRIQADGRCWAALSTGGELYVARGYAWDGASGPALNTINFARGSLVHDVLYQLIAAGELPRKPWIGHADAELYRIVREDGMPRWRAWWVWGAVRVFGHARDRFRADGL